MKAKKYFFIVIFMFTLTLICSCVTNQNSDFDIVDENFSAEQRYEDEKPENESPQNNYIDFIETFKNIQKTVLIKTVQSPSIPIKDKEFNKAYIFQITDQENNPLLNYPLILRYPITKNNDEVFFSEIKLQSDENGRISFTPKDTHFSCNSFIYVYPSIDNMEKLNKNEIHEIDNYIEKKSFRVPYQVKTNLSNIGGSICLADYDKNGNLVTTNGYSTSALSISLRQKGFTSIGNLEFYKEIDNGNTEALLQKVRNLAGAVSFYFIYGTIKYSKPPFLNENKQYEVSLDCEISCVVLKTSEILYRTKVQVTGFGNTEAAALNDARNSKMNSLLSEKIIYGM